jgi:hypothetical protein
MWYKLAQNAEKAFETLKEKGVSQDNISKLQEMTDLALRGKYIGALMQNPLMSWNELEEKLSPKKTNNLSIQEIRYMSELDRMISNTNLPEDQKANFYKWVDRVAIPSYRPNQFDPENYTYPKFSQMPNPLYGIQGEINHIYDWYVDHLDQSPRFNIFSMTLDQALQASDRWHEELANKTSTKTFTKIKKENGQIVDSNVVFIFDKEIIDRIDLSEKYVGWMIVKITEENDFDIEGDIMGHCVGTNNYFDQFQRGAIEIFSLRDESNQPHATIEIDLPDSVQQIKGKGNSRPKDDYLKLIQQWIYQGKYYSKDKTHDHEFYFTTGSDENRALESIQEYLNPYFDEDSTDGLGVPLRPVTVDENEFVEEFDIDYLIDKIGQKRGDYYDDPEFYKSSEEINYEAFEELISYIGDMFIRHDINYLKEYAKESRPLGINQKEVKAKLKIEVVKDHLMTYIDEELEQIVEPQSRKFREEDLGPARSFNFKDKNPEEIDDIAMSPYRREPKRGRAKFDEDGEKILKQYDGIYDVYSVYFADELYEYMLKNLSSEFYGLANKIGLNLDLSPVTPSSVVKFHNKYRNYNHGRNRQLELFDTNSDVSPEKWIYAYNHKKFRLAAVQDEGLSDFSYNDLFKPSKDISNKQILENIKDFYISKSLQTIRSEGPDPDYDGNYFADITEELHLMWEEYIDDIKKGDINSLKSVIEIALEYESTLSEDSNEREKLSQMISSGSIALVIKRDL